MTDRQRPRVAVGSMSASQPQPAATPEVVDRAAFDAALAALTRAEKEVTRHNDRVSAARRRLPMLEVEDYEFTGPDGAVRLTDLFGDMHLLVVQNVMFGPDWNEACPRCTWAVDNLPQNMNRLTDQGIAFAIISHAPVEKLEIWRKRHGWSHWWVSSGATTYHHDFGWTDTDENGDTFWRPGYSYYLLNAGKPYLTYSTTARGTEALFSVSHIMDRTIYGRRQDWEDSPAGWPQRPTYS